MDAAFDENSLPDIRMKITEVMALPGRKKGKAFPSVFSVLFLFAVSIGLPEIYNNLPLSDGIRAVIEQEVYANRGNSASAGSPVKKTDVPAGQFPSVSELPPYQGAPYVTVNGNRPNFSLEDLTTTSFERYTELDHLGRCGTAYANIGVDLMPTEKREAIGQIKPSGWHTVRYDDIIDKKYLYNRCHLIGYQLSGENANPKNLITGTRYLNVEGMLPWENKVANYVRSTNHHVLYRVTPVFRGNHLVADGVLIEAMSVEDRGKGICFHVFCYNVQPGIIIDYATGKSRPEKT